MPSLEWNAYPEVRPQEGQDDAPITPSSAWPEMTCCCVNSIGERFQSVRTLLSSPEAMRRVLMPLYDTLAQSQLNWEAQPESPRCVHMNRKAQVSQKIQACTQAMNQEESRENIASHCEELKALQTERIENTNEWLEKGSEKMVAYYDEVNKVRPFMLEMLQMLEHVVLTGKLLPMTEDDGYGDHDARYWAAVQAEKGGGLEKATPIERRPAPGNDGSSTNFYESSPLAEAASRKRAAATQPVGHRNKRPVVCSQLSPPSMSPRPASHTEPVANISRTTPVDCIRRQWLPSDGPEIEHNIRSSAGSSALTEYSVEPSANYNDRLEGSMRSSAPEASDHADNPNGRVYPLVTSSEPAPPSTPQGSSRLSSPPFPQGFDTLSQNGDPSNRSTPEVEGGPVVREPTCPFTGYDERLSSPREPPLSSIEAPAVEKDRSPSIEYVGSRPAQVIVTRSEQRDSTWAPPKSKRHKTPLPERSSARLFERGSGKRIKQESTNLCTSTPRSPR